MDENKSWIQIKVKCASRDIDTVSSVMSMVDNGLMIEDYSDFSLNGMYGELVDESILNADREAIRVSLFVPEERNPLEYREFLQTRLPALGIEGEISLEGMNEDDWAESWKQYYKPVPLGKVTIVPAWEKYEAKEGEILVRMDPGMAFGTGSHETTRGIIQMLENCITDGCTVLDVGCGSGILAICAAKYGAGLCRAYDIDPIAVEVAAENAIENGCEIECAESDLLAGVKAEQYDVICANIVADIIIRMAPDVGRFMKDTSTLLASGIITERAEEVTDAIEAAGLYIVESIEDNGWCALAVKKLIK